MSTSVEKTDKTKRRSDMACRRCRARKLKCENTDSVAPCKRCEGENLECVFLSVADDAGAMGGKPPKSASISRGSSEEGRNNHPVTPVSPTQIIPSIPSGRTPNQNISPPLGRGSHHDPAHTYSTYSHPQHPQLPHHGRANASPPPGFSGPGYRREGSFPAVGGSQNQWSASTQPVYPMHPSMTPQYVNQGSSRPSVPIPPGYAYSSSSDSSYPPSMYGSDQEPRSFNNQGYYNPVDSGHELSNPEQYYLASSSYPHNPQPNGLPGYPDPNIISNAQQDTGSDYYYTR